MRTVKALVLSTIFLLGASTGLAQRPASPRGQAAIQLGGEYEDNKYVGGKWIVVDYGRPILRGRTGIFGAGDEYGKKLNAGAPVWRAGANKSTRFTTEADLVFGDKTLPAGEYSMFIDLKENAWTLIFSTHDAKESGRDPGDALWGAYNYTDDKDALRVPMTVRTMRVSYEQLTIGFVNATKTGATLSVLWDTALGSVNFSLN